MNCLTFKTKEDIDNYFNCDKLECLICGKHYKALGTHIIRKHDVCVDEYKEMFCLPWTPGLVGKSTKKKQGAALIKRIEAGFEVGVNVMSAEVLKKFRKSNFKQRPHCPANKLENVKRSKGSFDRINKVASENKKIRLAIKEIDKNKKKHLKEERNIQIIKLHKEGLSRKKIKDRMHIAENVIKSILQSNGLSLTKQQVEERAIERKKEIYKLIFKRKMSIKDVSEKVGVSYCRVQQVIREIKDNNELFNV